MIDKVARKKCVDIAVTHPRLSKGKIYRTPLHLRLRTLPCVGAESTARVMRVKLRAERSLVLMPTDHRRPAVYHDRGFELSIIAPVSVLYPTRHSIFRLSKYTL